jgi:hypothetical protein
MTVSQQVTLTPGEPDLDIWEQRVDALGLELEGSPVWPLIETLYEELGQAGITLRPPCYVANEWGCPDGQPLIGIPFYLIDPRLHGIEEEYADDLEDDARILEGLRHEAGHAINYAYKLYTHPEWEAVFGQYDLPYEDDYYPEPFTRRCVRHLPGWYAQKHPDEDFAETFAVWLTPGLNWREKYAGWPALAKLELLDRMMKEVGGKTPLIDPRTVVPDPCELDFTLGGFYDQRTEIDAPPVDGLEALDDDLRAAFTAEGLGTDAASLVLARRRIIMRSVSGHVGSRLYVVKVLVDALAARARTLGLRVSHGKEVEALITITSLVSSLVTNFVRFGSFLPAPVPAGQGQPR